MIATSLSHELHQFPYEVRVATTQTFPRGPHPHHTSQYYSIGQPWPEFWWGQKTAGFSKATFKVLGRESGPKRCSENTSSGLILIGYCCYLKQQVAERCSELSIELVPGGFPSLWKWHWHGNERCWCLKLLIKYCLVLTKFGPYNYRNK